MNDMKNLPESYWKEKLTPEQYNVVRRRERNEHLVARCITTMKRECTIVSHVDSPCSPRTPSLNQGLDGPALTIQ